LLVHHAAKPDNAGQSPMLPRIARRSAILVIPAGNFPGQPAERRVAGQLKGMVEPRRLFHERLGRSGKASQAADFHRQRRNAAAMGEYGCI
jgi:hypothetical protein